MTGNEYDRFQLHFIKKVAFGSKEGKSYKPEKSQRLTGQKKVNHQKLMQ